MMMPEDIHADSFDDMMKLVPKGAVLIRHYLPPCIDPFYLPPMYREFVFQLTEPSGQYKGGDHVIFSCPLKFTLDHSI